MQHILQYLSLNLKNNVSQLQLKNLCVPFLIPSPSLPTASNTHPVRVCIPLLHVNVFLKMYCCLRVLKLYINGIILYVPATYFYYFNILCLTFIHIDICHFCLFT